MPNSREFLPADAVRPERITPPEAAAAGLDYPSTPVGTVGRITVEYTTSLGQNGQTLAQRLLAVVEPPYVEMESFFGVAGGATTVIVAPLSGHNDGSGGAYHYGCDFASGGVLYLDATFDNTTIDPTDLELSLCIAELSEAFMGAQGTGWGCGFSNGEGLSRYLAEVMPPPGSFPAWGVSGPSWAAAGFPDWVSRTENTDRDYVSTGCAVVYLYWVRSLGFSTRDIVAAAGATLSANYQRLTGKTTAYADLKAALQGLTVNSDDPFPSRPVTRSQGNAIALVRQTPGWASIPVAFANGDGTWHITNGPAPDFIGEDSWSSAPGVHVIAGDFNGNGLTDLALVRQTPGWASIPIAFANGDGTWHITNGPAPDFIGEDSWSSAPGVHVIAGDFNGNGLTDLALVRQTPGWASIPVAFANGDGTWHITNGPAPDFIGEDSWSSAPGVHVIAGDFNGNGLTDLALVRQTPGWASIPIAFANGDGTWHITNGPAPDFIGEDSWSSAPGVHVIAGDFNGNGLTDLALVRQTPGWASIPVAFANGDGTWHITNGPAPDFIGEDSWSSAPGVHVIAGDFNGNGLTDLALVRQTPGWASIPVAFANGDGTWHITNGPAPDFIGEDSWSSAPGVHVIAGDFNGNGLTDLALVRQTPGWASIPVAFANGDGSWKITNGPAPDFIPSWANQPAVRLVPGDYR